MTLNIPTALNAEGLTAVEQTRKAVRDILRQAITDFDDETIWALTLEIVNKVAIHRPPTPVSLTYAWSDGKTMTVIDQAAPDNVRERAIARALLLHALAQIEERDHPLSIIGGLAQAMPCSEG